MYREKLVGAGKQYAPTLYTVLVSASDDRKLFGFYPTMAAEIETYLVAKGTEGGLDFDGRPLVRFIVDDKLKSGKFDIIAENVAAPIVAQLRDEELEFWGLKAPEPSEPGLAAGADAGGFAAAGVGGLRAAGVAAEDLAGLDVAGDFNSVDLDRIPDTLDPATGGLIDLDPNSGGVVLARLTDLNAQKSYALTSSSVVLGRDSPCDIVINDANISRRHARLARDERGFWILSDLKSTNGTRVNGRPISSTPLRDGDQLSFGVTILEFREC
jgi:hypothetical protein